LKTRRIAFATDLFLCSIQAFISASVLDSDNAFEGLKISEFYDIIFL